jgi:hypothetical protein
MTVNSDEPEARLASGFGVFEPARAGGGRARRIRDYGCFPVNRLFCASSTGIATMRASCGIIRLLLLAPSVWHLMDAEGEVGYGTVVTPSKLRLALFEPWIPWKLSTPRSWGSLGATSSHSTVAGVPARRSCKPTLATRT